MPPARPETQPTPEEQAARRKLAAEIVAAIAVITAAELASAQTREILARAGFTYERIVKLMRQTFVNSALLSIVGVRMMARVRTATNVASVLYDNDLVELLSRDESVFALAHAKAGVKRVVTDMRNVAEQKEQKLVKMGKTLATLTKPEAAEFVAEVKDALAARMVETVIRERTYSKMRTDAVARRLDLRVEEDGVRRSSPEGAYWVLDLTRRTHTKDCLAMANRAWSWRVLTVIRPSNRHLGCGCRLYTLDFARATGMPDAERVRDRIPAAALHGH